MDAMSPNGTILKTLWRRDRQLGYIWLRAHITLNKLDDSSPYGLVFQALVGKGSAQFVPPKSVPELYYYFEYPQGIRGDVAIDEILFTPNRQCSPTAEISDLVGHYCDFETPESCGYNVPTPWRITKPQVGPLLYPKFDNTYRTSEGYFLQFVSYSLA